MQFGKKIRALGFYTVREAGAQVGLSRAGSYRAAANGHIPTVREGRFLYVPRRRWNRKKKRLVALTEGSTNA